MAAALDDPLRSSRAIDPKEIPLLPLPTGNRPCCAFGTGLRAEIAGVAVPGYKLQNIRGPEDLGPHRYGAGIVSIDSSDEHGALAVGDDGLVYTCRGGFIDSAHVRDSADRTLFLAAAIARTLEEGGSTELWKEGGVVRLTREPVPARAVDRAGRRILATRMAQWAAFQASVWHEIASWYGEAAYSAFPERISAFSPEDLYSNVLGVRIAGGVLLAGQVDDQTDYARAMDAWILRSLERLDAVPVAEGEAAIHSVDGIWWDSTKALPDVALVPRRLLDTGPEIRPWLVSMAGADPARRFRACDGRESILPLRVPVAHEGLRFAEIEVLGVTVSESLLEHGFPLPRPPSRVIMNSDFPALVEHIHQAMVTELGPNVGRPEADPGPTTASAPPAPSPKGKSATIAAKRARRAPRGAKVTRSSR